jgi:hypothetical protein
MDTRFEAHRVQLEADLAVRGLSVTVGAWRPLERLSWQTLQSIHDHEEAFLRDELIESIVTANRTRRQSGKGTAHVNAHDVTTAMLMLGRAVTRAPETSIAAPNKARIQQVCPYC